MKSKKKNKKEDFIEYTFKIEPTGLDFINSRVDKDKLISEIRLLSQVLVKPLKMSYEEIINLPIKKFMSLFIQYRLSYKDVDSKVNLEGYKNFFETTKKGFTKTPNNEVVSYEFPTSKVNSIIE